MAPWPRFTISAVILASTSGTDVGAHPYWFPSIMIFLLPSPRITTARAPCMVHSISFAHSGLRVNTYAIMTLEPLFCPDMYTCMMTRIFSRVVRVRKVSKVINRGYFCSNILCANVLL